MFDKVITVRGNFEILDTKIFDTVEIKVTLLTFPSEFKTLKNINRTGLRVEVQQIKLQIKDFSEVPYSD